MRAHALGQSATDGPALPCAARRGSGSLLGRQVLGQASIRRGARTTCSGPQFGGRAAVAGINHGVEATVNHQQRRPRAPCTEPRSPKRDAWRHAGMHHCRLEAIGVACGLQRRHPIHARAERKGLGRLLAAMQHDEPWQPLAGRWTGAPVDEEAARTSAAPGDASGGSTICNAICIAICNAICNPMGSTNSIENSAAPVRRPLSIGSSPQGKGLNNSAMIAAHMSVPSQGSQLLPSACDTDASKCQGRTCILPTRPAAA